MKKRDERGGLGDEAASEREQERERKGEPGCRGALPAVCVVHAFQPGGSKPGKGRAHTHTHTHSYIHTQTYTTIPKGDTFIESKNTLYTHLHDIVHSLKSTHTHIDTYTHTHTVRRVCGFQTGSLCTSLLALKCFDSERGRTNPSEMFFVAAPSQPTPNPLS